ncbi:MAG: extracellular solute-binding protein [Ruminococcus flavefaciens]|nr:extracellular solute-binding protein [Ruminococcus flavefaciens]
MKKKIIASLLTLSMICSIAACGGADNGNSSTASGNVSTGGQSSADSNTPFVTPTEVNPDKWQFDELQTITFCKVLNLDEEAQLPAGQSSDSNDVLSYIEETYNIKLVQSWTAGEVDYKQQLALHMSSGELPDLIYVSDYSQYKQLIDGGMVQPINDAYTNQCSEEFLEIEAASGGRNLATATIDGQLWGVPAGRDADQYDVLWMRKDWLDNLGLEEPKTLEEVEEVLRAFTQDDPDGNGQNDTCGLAVNATQIVTPQGVNYGLNPIFNSMGVYPDSWLLDDSGHVYNGSTDEKMKDVLTILQRWYTEGYIDQEFVSRTGEGQVEGIISGGTVGAFFGQWWAMPRDQGVLNGEWVPVAAPLNADGKYSYMRSDEWSDCIMVSASCKNPEAAIAALAISVDIAAENDKAGHDIACAAGNNGESNRNFFCYGVWTTGASTMINISNAIAEQIETGSYTPYEGIVAYDQDEIARAAGFADGSERTPDAAWSYYGRHLAYPLIKSDIGEGVSACWYWETPSSPTINTLISTEFDKAVLQIITGAASVDTYDAFITQWHSLGGDTIISEIESELGIQ